MNKKAKNPFPGLLSYNTNDSPTFYCREEETENVIEILQSTKFVALSGLKNTGKTSLINAGIIPRLKAGFNGQAGREWSICKFRPGISPIKNLAHALSNTGAFYLNKKSKTNDFKEFENTLTTNTDLGLINIYTASEIYSKKNLLIIIDHIEDLFSFPNLFDSQKEETGDTLFEIIYKTNKNKGLGIYFIIAIQNEYTEKLDYYERFLELYTHNQYNLPNISSSIERLIAQTFHPRNIQFSDEAINFINTEMRKNASLIPNLQLLLNLIYNQYGIQLLSDIKLITLKEIDQVGGLGSIVGFKLEELYQTLTAKEKKYLEYILKSLVHASEQNKNLFYQKFDFISESTEIPHEEISNIINIFKTELGDIFTVFGSYITGVHKKDVYATDDVLKFKYIPHFNWKRFEHWVVEEEELYRKFQDYHSRAKLYFKKEESLLTDTSLDIAVEWQKNKFIHNAWSIKYALDFDKTIEFINLSETARKQKLKKHKERLENIKKSKKKERIILSFLLSCIGLVLIVFSYNKHLETKRQTENTIKINKQKERLEISKRKSDSLNTVLKFQTTTLIKAKNDAKYLNKKLALQIKTKDYLMQSNKLKNDSILALSDSIEVKETFIQEKSDSLQISNKIIFEKTKKLDSIDKYWSLKKETSNLLYFIERTNPKEKNILKKYSQEVIKNYTELKSVAKFIGESFDDNTLRQLFVNLIAKLNGKENYVEIQKYNFLPISSNLPIRAIAFSLNNRIAAGGDEKMLYFSNAKINKNEKLINKIEFKSPINAVEFIDESVVAVGLKDNGLWLVNLDTKEKGLIYPSKKYRIGKYLKNTEWRVKEITSIFKSVHYEGIGHIKYISEQGLLCATNEDKLIVYNVSQKEFDEVYINLKPEEYITSFAYSEGSKLLILSTTLGTIIIFNTETKEIKKLNNQVLMLGKKIPLEIEFYNNLLFIGTNDGWIFTYKIIKGDTLDFVTKITSNRDRITDILHDLTLENLYSLSIDGDLSIIPVAELNNKENSGILEINLGKNNYGLDIISFSDNDLTYFITADTNGNLLCWDLNLERAFNTILKLYSKKFIN